MPGAINVIDLSYPIQPTGMSLLSVYPPLIIKAENASKRQRLFIPTKCRSKDGIPGKWVLREGDLSR